MRTTVRILSILIFCLIAKDAGAWGFWAHQRINRMAVFTLPPEMLGFYKMNLEYLTEHAVDPDKRRYAVDYEAPRHYIDIDHYGTYPFDNVPRKWNDAVSEFSEDTLKAYGIVPWHIQKDYYRLVDAFKAMDADRIMKISADIGHYIADSNVPLHTTENYNGQLTGQKGIHGLWESRLPEIFASNYDFFIGRANYVDDPLKKAWSFVLGSHIALDSVLGFERDLTSNFPSDQKYSYENRNNRLIRVYSFEFSKEYHAMLDGQVERRMRNSIFGVGSLWYSAWVDAGQPDLSSLMGGEVENEKIEFKRDLKIIDREKQDVGAVMDLPEIPGNPTRSYGMLLPEIEGQFWIKKSWAGKVKTRIINFA